MRASSRGALITAALIVPSVAAEAQERVGPNAVPPPLPGYANPRGITAPTPAIGAPQLDGTVTLSDVRVRESEALVARPLPGWSPSRDPATNLTLSLTPPQPLNAQWVRRQFTANDLVGREVPLDRLVSMVQLINLAFVANGYLNSGILIAGGRPADGGILELDLVYGRLRAPTEDASPVSLHWGPGGPRGLNQDYVLDRMAAAATPPLNATRVERQFRLLAEDPAIQTINADLRPGTRPGEATLALTVVPKERFDFYLTASNSRSPSIGGERFASGGSMRNLLTSGDIVTAEVGLTEGKADVLGSYELPLKDAVTSFRLRGGHNEAAVVDRPLRPLDINARDWNGELSLNRRLVQSPLLPAGEPGRWNAARTIAVGLAVAHRRTVTTLLGRRFSFSPGSVDGRAEYTVLRLTADWVERGVNQVLALSLIGTQGIGGTLGDVPGLLSPDPNFRALLGQFSLARRLDRRGLELKLRLTGQAADGILYSGERLAAGGEYSVRGYRETLVLADTGVIGSVELAQGFSLTRGRRNAAGFDWGAFQASVFADGALLHNRAGPKPVPNELASVGTSLAWTPSDAIFARATYAEALNAAPLVGSRDLQDRGFQFRVTIRPLALWRMR